MAEDESVLLSYRPRKCCSAYWRQQAKRQPHAVPARTWYKSRIFARRQRLRTTCMVAATSAIDSAASAKHVTDATISSTAFDTPLSAVSWSYKPAAGSPAAPRLRGRTLQQASAAFSSVQAEFFGMQRASSDQSTASSSTQHDSDVGSAHMHSLSACCDDFTPEKYPDHAQEPTSARYSIDAVHYSRHQVSCYRLPVRACCKA